MEIKDSLLNLSVTWQVFILGILGLVSNVAFTPYYQVWILLISFSMFSIFLFYSKGFKQSFLFGYVFGFGFFLGGLYWIANALFVDIGAYFYLVPLAIVAIPALLSLYIGFLSVLVHYFNNKQSARFFIVFVSLWVLVEILRTYIFTGFPWLALGYSLMFSESLIQSASVFGVFGLSFIVISCACIPFLAFHLNKSNVVILSLVVLVSLGNFVFGWQRLQNPTEYYNHNVIVIQPNISQKDKIDPKKFAEGLDQMISLTTQPKDFVSESGYIMWPETALGGYYRTPLVKQIINNIIPDNHYLVTGVERLQGDRIYNSVMVYDTLGREVASYDKFHLVPFGEYLPLRKLFPQSMYNLSNGLVDFEAGKGPQTITLEALPSFSPLICYESLFPKEIIDVNVVKPKFLVNLTNDAWYGDTSGPYQHFEMTRLRAVEYGMPMVRVANTGISGVIDSYGRIKAYLSLNTTGVIQKKIPLPLKKASIFSKFGNTNIILFIVIFLLLALFSWRTQDA